MYKYELHMHTREGSACGRKSIHDMIKRYHSLGFSGAVVTNHFTRGNTAIDRSLDWDSFLDGYCFSESSKVWAAEKNFWFTV